MGDTSDVLPKSRTLTPSDPAFCYGGHWGISCPICFSFKAETLICLSRVTEQVLLWVESLKWDCPHSNGLQTDTCSLGHLPTASLWLSGHQQPPGLWESQIWGRPFIVLAIKQFSASLCPRDLALCTQELACAEGHTKAPTLQLHAQRNDFLFKI